VVSESSIPDLCESSVTRFGGHEDGIRVDQCSHGLLIGNIVIDGTTDTNGIKFSHSLHCAAIGNVCHHNNQPNLELLHSQWCVIAHNVSTSSDEWGVISRTTVGASRLTSVPILPPYQDATEREYQVQSWINTGHAIEGNIAVDNKSGGISIRGTSNSIVAGNVTALNNQAQSTWGVAGISIGFGDGEGSEVPSVENVVADNRSYDDQQNRTQAYGLRFHTGPNLVIGNDTIGNAIDGCIDESGNNAVGGSENNR